MSKKRFKHQFPLREQRSIKVSANHEGFNIYFWPISSKHMAIGTIHLDSDTLALAASLHQALASYLDTHPRESSSPVVAEDPPPYGHVHLELTPKEGDRTQLCLDRRGECYLARVTDQELRIIINELEEYFVLEPA